MLHGWSRTITGGDQAGNMPEALMVPHRKIGLPARLLLSSVLWVSCGCSSDPIAPEAEWVVGAWSFVEANCWPDTRVTPETLGYSVDLRLRSNGTAEVSAEAGTVQRSRFEVSRRNAAGFGEALVLEFDEPVLFAAREFSVAEGDTRETLHLAMWGVVDGCGYRFTRQ
jgi:hypothetical protein